MRADRIIALVQRGVKQKRAVRGAVKPVAMPKTMRFSQARLLAWREVLARHKTLRGIGKNSILVDRGESGYRNQFDAQGQIIYQGEGQSGNQLPVGGNQILLQALERRKKMWVYLREAPNVWRPLGRYRVVSVEYRLDPEKSRYVYFFCLRSGTPGQLALQGQRRPLPSVTKAV